MEHAILIQLRRREEITVRAAIWSSCAQLCRAVHMYVSIWSWFQNVSAIQDNLQPRKLLKSR